MSILDLRLNKVHTMYIHFFHSYFSHFKCLPTSSNLRRAKVAATSREIPILWGSRKTRLFALRPLVGTLNWCQCTDKPVLTTTETPPKYVISLRLEMGPVFQNSEYILYSSCHISGAVSHVAVEISGRNKHLIINMLHIRGSIVNF